MGDDIGYDTFFTINSYGQPTVEYRPIRPIGNNLLYESPIQQYYNSLCSSELTEEQSDAFQQFIKAEQKRKEKERNYKQFKEFTKMLERTYYN